MQNDMNTVSHWLELEYFMCILRLYYSLKHTSLSHKAKDTYRISRKFVENWIYYRVFLSLLKVITANRDIYTRSYSNVVSM